MQRGLSTVVNQRELLKILVLLVVGRIKSQAVVVVVVVTDAARDPLSVMLLLLEKAQMKRQL